MTSEGDKWTYVSDEWDGWIDLPRVRFYGIWSTESEYAHWIGLWPNEGLFTKYPEVALGALRALKGAIRRLRETDTLQVYKVSIAGLPEGEPL
jgi:hypothetical protein